MIGVTYSHRNVSSSILVVLTVASVKELSLQRACLLSICQEIFKKSFQFIANLELRATCHSCH